MSDIKLANALQDSLRILSQSEDDLFSNSAREFSWVFLVIKAKECWSCLEQLKNDGEIWNNRQSILPKEPKRQESFFWKQKQLTSYSN